VDARPVVERVVELLRRRDLVLVGIGGRGGAGKTTLAHMIPGAVVIGTDEFWDGTGFDLGRLRRQAFEPLLAGRDARFASFDWKAQEPRGERVVRPHGPIVVEGVCALHRLFRDDYQLRVWVEAPRELRLARGLERDGEDARSTWEDVWMPMEDRYIARDDPVSAADLIVDGSGGGQPSRQPSGRIGPGSLS
jgi:uridine kinase